jgi:hypothetical protein
MDTWRIGIKFPESTRKFIFNIQPHIQRYQESSPGVNRPPLEADHSPPPKSQDPVSFAIDLMVLIGKALLLFYLSLFTRCMSQRGAKATIFWISNSVRSYLVGLLGRNDRPVENTEKQQV